MSSRSHSGGRVERAGGRHAPPTRTPSAPMLQVQRSRSRETITIHFSALGVEDELEEQELYGPTSLPPSSLHRLHSESQRVAMAMEASEELLCGESNPVSVALPSGASLQQVPDPQMVPSPGLPALPPATSSLSWQSGQKASLPSKSVPSPKPFLSLMKSLSVEAEGQEALATPSTKLHCHLVKSLVKSLSTDTSRLDLEPAAHRPTDGRRSLHLFKPFAQSYPEAAGDSKTAPSSPLSSPDERPFFNVPEVEARIEDTRRRLSEAMSEPLQLLSKIMGDESSGAAPCSSKTLSSSALELTSPDSMNDHLDSNSLQERETSWAGDARTLALDSCSMSALVRQQDEEFCHLYSEVQGSDTNTELVEENPEKVDSGNHEAGHGEKDEEEVGRGEMVPGIPHKSLLTLAALVYSYLVLPLPAYLGGVLLGVAAGFLLATFMVWLAAPRRPHCCRSRCKPWTGLHLAVQEPGVFKGWMNEIYSYDPETYHASLTHSVFVRLEGPVLRLSKPSRSIARRATFSESKPDVTYVSQKTYCLTDSKVYLMPQNLARKRLWNKKYPICVELTKQQHFMPKAQADQDEDGGDGAEEVSRSEELPGPSFGALEPSQTLDAKDHKTLYLFGRTGREKEEWFRRLSMASRLKAEPKKVSGLPVSFLPAPSCTNSQAGGLTHSRSSSRGSLDELLASQPRQKELTGALRQKMLLDYTSYMAQYIPTQQETSTHSPNQSPKGSPGASKKLPRSSEEEAEAEAEAWVNALLGRIFWDFLGEKYWADMVSKKIQMKLSKIRLPYFMNELTLTELDMGVAIPKILQASKPTVDHQGLWFDLEISYNGSVLMTLETKMNLARLGKEGEGLRLGEPGKDGFRPRTYCLADSDEESSSAGSSDEEDPSEIPTDKNLQPGAEGYVGGHRPSKIMRFVDKIAKSKYFQKATETEFIKKKMEEVSNTPLLLTVEVQELRGTLAVNVPPPPTDRIWYGFRSPPHLSLKARPKLGEREVTLAHVTDWIEKKLDQEFQKIFVMPNMDDIWLPIMHSAMDTRSDVSSVAMTAEALKELDSTEVMVPTSCDD
ncbi:testis-expressed sequence 2 protein-like isoform X1 [Arapaima gigas]